jgi:hypothetical protein
VDVEQAAKYVAAAYAIILAGLAAWTIWTARRVSSLEREAHVLSEELERRGGRGDA